MNEISEHGSAPARALVLGGGGPVGASWEAALVLGLTTAGFSAADSDVVLGTSAGALVGAWLTMRPTGLAGLPDLMRQRAAWHAERAANGRSDREKLTRMMSKKPGAGGPSMLALAQAAVEAEPPLSAAEAAELWQRRAPEGSWPRNLAMASVDVKTGQARAWSADDRLPLAVGIACSTAAPGVAPAVDVAGTVWVDGGVRSSTNADLAVEAGGGLRGGGKVLIVACRPMDDLAREEAILAERGCDVRVLVSEPYYGQPSDLLDGRFIDAATEAGARQAREVAGELTKWWNEQ
ncbi:patatin-like phospholipase family protein [Amycolatopsis rhabdoformis]|uniref:Patatin-like phospholipase family protein n=1 Tax=Amycolatopsis rhabdoformis TaxID=1448059 RepID=A0ABZ1IG38_9PSEU|nr:patatin-like phospholipase family protein [Amycolatopsis rhabdoformis]WSE32524.1 patatin-like phospholipase family protein [Amycolatopsis rhabdoformis]